MQTPGSPARRRSPERNGDGSAARGDRQATWSFPRDELVKIEQGTGDGSPRGSLGAVHGRGQRRRSQRLGVIRRAAQRFALAAQKSLQNGGLGRARRAGQAEAERVVNPPGVAPTRLAQEAGCE